MCHSWAIELSLSFFSYTDKVFILHLLINLSIKLFHCDVIIKYVRKIAVRNYAFVNEVISIVIKIVVTWDKAFFLICCQNLTALSAP